MIDPCLARKVYKTMDRSFLIRCTVRKQNFTTHIVSISNMYYTSQYCVSRDISISRLGDEGYTLLHNMKFFLLWGSVSFHISCNVFRVILPAVTKKKTPSLTRVIFTQCYIQISQNKNWSREGLANT